MTHSRSVSAVVVVASVMTQHACALSASGREERVFKQRIRAEFCRPGQDSLGEGLHGYDQLSLGGEPARRALLAIADSGPAHDRLCALSLLVELKEARAISVLADVLDRPSETAAVKDTAQQDMRALEELLRRSTVPELERTLATLPPKGADAALSSLATILLVRETHQARAAAVTAISRIRDRGRRGALAKSAVDALQEQRTHSSSDADRMSIQDLISKLEGLGR